MHSVSTGQAPSQGCFPLFTSSFFHTVTLWFEALIFTSCPTSHLPSTSTCYSFLAHTYVLHPHQVNPESGVLSLPNLGQKPQAKHQSKLCLLKQVVTPTKTPYSEQASDRQGGPLDSSVLEIKPFKIAPGLCRPHEALAGGVGVATCL